MTRTITFNQSDAISQMISAVFLFLTLLLTRNSCHGSSSQLATCRQICQNVGVQLKSNVVPSQILQADNEIFKSEVQANVRIMMAMWEVTTKSLQDESNRQIDELRKELRYTQQAFCPLSFNGRCFWAVFEKNMNYSTAEKVCARISNGKPANIYGHDHLFMVTRYLRGLVRRNQVSVYAWLGMTVDPDTEKVLFTNGQSPRYLKWRQNQPDFTLSYTQLMIMARTDGNQKQEGLYNQNPAYEKPAVLCEA